MARENFEAALIHVLESEGGYSQHPRDPGGMTNLGVTKRVWENWIGREVDEAEMRSLTPKLIGPMYKQMYWDKIKGDDLPAGLDYVVFDAAVNSGPSRAAKWLQSAVGAVPDGIIGPATLRAVQSHLVADLIATYQATRLEFLKNLATWDTFGKGWGRRVAEVTAHSAHIIA
jgi:lysozyme family protein